VLIPWWNDLNTRGGPAYRPARNPLGQRRKSPESTPPPTCLPEKNNPTPEIHNPLFRSQPYLMYSFPISCMLDPFPISFPPSIDVFQLLSQLALLILLLFCFQLSLSFCPSGLFGPVSLSKCWPLWNPVLKVRSLLILVKRGRIEKG